MDEVIGGLLAERVDIEGPAAGDVGQAGVQLAGAVAGIRAAPVRIVSAGRGQGSAALRAQAAEEELALRTISGVLHRAQDLRDDLPGLADHDLITQAHALAVGLGRIVQGRHGHGGARDVLRLHHRIRGRPAGAPDP